MGRLLFLFITIGILLFLLIPQSSGFKNHSLADLFTNKPVYASSAWSRHIIDGSSRGADGARFTDANKDGRLDIATGWEQGDKVKVYLNPGATSVKSLWPKIEVGDIGSVEDAFLVDLDNDGATDVVTSSESPINQLTVFWAPKNQSDYTKSEAWTKQILTPSDNVMEWMFGAAVQLDGKNGLDIIAGGKLNNAQIGWFESPINPRNTRDWMYHKIGNAGWVMSIEPTDMDGDGDLDVLATDRDAGIVWFENPGQGIAQKSPWPVHNIGGQGHSAAFLVQADVDKDGLIDVVTVSNGITYSRRLSPNGLSWENFSINLRASGIPAYGAKGVAVGDINKDGKNDIAFSGSEVTNGATGVFWLSYRNSPKDSIWDGHEIETMSTGKFDLVSLLDLDIDGDLDFVTTEERANLGVVWWENPYPNLTTSSQSDSDVDRNGCIDIRDFNEWVHAMNHQGNPRQSTFKPDVNGDGAIDILDFNMWSISIRSGEKPCS